MPQDPFKVDQLQIEPGSTGTRKVRRASDGSLEFVDPNITAGVTLKKLAGLKNIANMLVVGLSGIGVSYTTIQEALDAIPTNSSELNPYTVVVCPGVYAETVTIVRDGVTLLGLGDATIHPEVTTPNAEGADHTVIVQAGDGTIPKAVRLLNIRLVNVHDGYAALHINGNDADVGITGVVLRDCVLDASESDEVLPFSATNGNQLELWNCTLLGEAAPSLDETTTLTSSGVVYANGILTQNGANVAGVAVSGTATLAGTALSNVTLPFTMASSSYEVRLELAGDPGVGEVPWVTTKTTTGFRINFAASTSVTVRWVVDGRLG